MLLNPFRCSQKRMLFGLGCLTLGLLVWYAQVAKFLIPNRKRITSAVSSVISIDSLHRIANEAFNEAYIEPHKWAYRTHHPIHDKDDIKEDVGPPKIILYWSKWFRVEWSVKFGPDTPEGLRDDGCPSWNCLFVYNRSLYNISDAVIFRAGVFKNKSIPRYRPSPNQRWLWAEVESPPAGPARWAHTSLKRGHISRFVNWTMTYHNQSDIVAQYGYFLSLNETSRPLRPNLMSSHKETMTRYISALNRGITLEDVMGPSWKDFIKRPKIVGWLSSHCGTNSKREQYIRELSKYIQVDKYGGCGTYCGKNPRSECWEFTLGKNYSFYMSMENNICDQYITEKLYYALKYNMLPVVWGGSNYSDFLPKDSYINARLYHPKELATLLYRLRKDPVAYGRYHVWRGFWQVMRRGSFCELCYRLHNDNSLKSYDDIPKWRNANNKCIRAPRDMFNDTLNPTAWRKLISSNYTG